MVGYCSPSGGKPLIAFEYHCVQLEQLRSTNAVGSIEVYLWYISQVAQLRCNISTS